MSEYFGDGTTRTLSARARQFVNVVWQKGKPPLDSELNLVAQINEEAQQAIVSSAMSSGWLGNVLDPMSDYDFDPQASNMFWLGKDVSGTEGDAIWANVNGWLIPVVGTRSGDMRNAILLPPPKTDVSDSDVNFVFLEVWKAQISPDGSVNKPAQNLLYRYGNTEYGGQNLTNDLLDPAILFETTERVQLQYRIRVEPAVNPLSSPHGFGAGIKAQGALDNPTVSTNPVFQFQNMGDTLGDPGLWRAGTGDGDADPLGTVDGYVYAIPLCFVFRRTRNEWSFIQQTGATDRNPTMTDRLEATVLPTIRLTSAIEKDDLVLEVDTTQGSTTLDPNGGLVRIDNEIMEYSTYSGTTITVSERGARDTHATMHGEDAVIHFVTGHPLGLFSDQIVAEDVLDLRHILSPDGLDYDGILRQNFQKLAQGSLASTWKMSGANVKGRKHFQIDHFGPSSNAPDYTISGDRPDGLRKVFSDACVLQPNNVAILGSVAATSSATDLTMNPAIDIQRADGDSWTVNDAVTMSLAQFRAQIPTSSNQKVRFVHPFEYDGSEHYPIRLWFGEVDPASGSAPFEGALTLDSEDTNPWFMVFGSRARDLSAPVQGSDSLVFDNGTQSIEVPGIDFGPDEASLLEQGAWIVITPSTAGGASTDPQNRGAYRITGVNGSGHLVVETASGAAPSFGGTTNRDWELRLTSCKEDDDNLLIVLVRDPASNSTLNFSYDLLYHPTRGVSRVPETSLHVELHTTSTSYVRENTYRNVAVDPTRAAKKSPVAPLTAYPHHHNKKFEVRNQQDVAYTKESVWTEAYVDRGSKTLVYQPLRNMTVRLDPQSNPSTFDYADVTGIFNTDTNDPEASVLVPKELRAPLGRIDLPFVKSLSAVPPESPAYGINHLFHTGVPDTALTDSARLVAPRVRFLYAPNNTGPADFGTWADILATTGEGPAENALICRYYNRGGVKGIELPPHYGVARLFAAHFVEDYDGTSILSPSTGYRTASGTNRLNLLREDNERRSLIITDDNTFVIPEDVLDPSYIQLTETGNLCPDPNAGPLSDQTLIFEIATFFFDDWTADFTRIHRRDGLNFALGTEGNFRMFINGPVETGHNFYLVNTRVPYQGSIYGTMPKSATDTDALEFTDYLPKRDTERPTSILDLFTALDEDDARVENKAKLEILATLPFATTLGTGVVSGEVVPGSYTDVGYLSLETFPFTSGTQEERASVVRAHPFTPDGEVVAPPLSEALAGVTERLPLGLVVGDYQFLGEGLGPDYSRFWAPHVAMDAMGDYQRDKLLSNPLEDGSIVFSDGTSSQTYSADSDMYRTYRGGTVMATSGGSVVLTGGRTSKDLSYVRDVDAHNLQMHGAVLFGVAFLVRNTKEVVTDSEVPVTFGDEVQMLVLTGITLGQELDLSGNISKEFIDLLLQMHPRGVGEGYCAADRFRVEGRPLQKSTRNKELGSPVFRGRDPS